MGQGVCPRSQILMPQDLLDRPERHVVEPAYESNNIGGDLPLVLLVPLAAAQFLRLDGTEYGQVQQGQLQMNIDHYNGDRLDGHEADEPERQGPQEEQEVGQGKKGIDDQSDPAD